MGNITISFQDLGFFILFCLALAVGIFIIVTLSNFNKTIKRFNGFMDSSSDSVKKILVNLPEAVKSVDEAASNIRDNVEKIGSVVDTVEEAVTETAAAVNDKTEGLINTFDTISSVLKIIIDTFSSSREKK
jgi:ABC-type transporter Mla subunit MlaD